MPTTITEELLTSGTNGNIGGRSLQPGPGTWTNISSNQIQFLNASPNYLVGAVNLSATYKTGTDAAHLNDEAEIDMYVTTITQARCGVGLGVSGVSGGGNRTWYTLLVDNVAPNYIYLNKFDEANGVDIRAAETTTSVSLNTLHTLRLRREDNGDGTVQLIGFLNGTQLFSWEDATPLLVGRSSIRLSNGGRIYRFLHTQNDAPGGGGGETPSFRPSVMMLMGI